MNLRYIDLFAGCGGLSLGLHNAGYKGIFAVEKSEDAFATLQHNLIDKRNHFDWPEWLALSEWDIDALLKRKASSLRTLKGKVDLLAGGPPCQGFSMAGQRVAADARNALVHSYLSFVRLVVPRVILFENVYGFTVRHTTGNDDNQEAYSDVVVQALRKLGYADAHGRMIDMSEYGVPQRRQRFIVIATREGLSGKIFQALESHRKTFLASKGLRAQTTVRMALSDLEHRHGAVASPDSGGYDAGITSGPKNNFQRLLRISGLRRYQPDSHRFVKHTAQVRAVFAGMQRKAPRNKRLIGDLRIPFGIKKRSIILLAPDKPSLTITTIPDDFVHYSEPRVMTVRECARLQTFPDWFEFRGPYTTGGHKRRSKSPRYTQVGNAVPPLFAEQLGLAIKEALRAK